MGVKFRFMKALLSCLLSLLLFANCSTTGGALPQASVPIPKSDPITIASPSPVGLVTVTGASNAVPGDVTLIALVSSASARFDLDLLLNLFVGTALAQKIECPSELPACPTLSVGCCQAMAMSDGSLTFTVPASVNDKISVDFLDPDNDGTQTQIVPYSNSDIDTTHQTTLVSDANDTVIENLSFLAVAEFVFPPIGQTDTVDCFSLGFQNNQTDTRAFFTNGSQLFIVDSIDDFSLNSKSDSGNLIPRSVTLQLTNFPDASVVAIPFMAVLGDTFFVIAGFSEGSSDSITYDAIEIKQGCSFCEDNLSLGDETKWLLLANTASDVFATAFAGQDDGGNAITKIGLLNVNNQTIKFINGTDRENTETLAIKNLVRAYDGLAVSNIVRFFGDGRSNNTVFELFLLGQNNDGGGIVASNGSATGFGSDTLVNAINPVSLVKDKKNGRVIVRDAGLAGAVSPT